MKEHNWTHPLMEGLPVTGVEIEKLSHVMIEEAVGDIGLNSSDYAVMRRMVHACGDVDIAKSFRIHPDAVDNAIASIRSGKPIFCDVNMLKSGITRVENELVCAIKDESVANYAKVYGTTRAWAQVQLLGDKLNDAIICIGNAPTAIWSLLNLYDLKKIKPALVVGTPVGFVGAAESKQALFESDLTYVTSLGNKGGSAMAAAAMNAICILERERRS